MFRDFPYCKLHHTPRWSTVRQRNACCQPHRNSTRFQLHQNNTCFQIAPIANCTIRLGGPVVIVSRPMWQWPVCTPPKSTPPPSHTSVPGLRLHVLLCPFIYKTLNKEREGRQLHGWSFGGVQTCLWQAFHSILNFHNVSVVRQHNE